MAAEIVETRRIYARTVARIDPEWIEHAGRHLLKISYSDAHWSRKPAQVVAAMRATLYGLPVVNGRKVHYGPIDPIRSREIFIRSALVEGEYDTRSTFFVYNQRLLKDIDEHAHRARDVRLEVDEQDLYNWFDERIPEHVYNGAAFEKWLREAEAKSPKLLHLRREDLLKERGANPRDFPKELDLGGVRFALAYRFDPGSEDDGVTLLVPLPALNQVPGERCDWLVPGLLEEKMTALIKSLPQSVRRAFVPVPEFARAAAQALTPGSATLTDALADFLARTTGQTIPRDAWRLDALTPHLTMNYRVLDDNNRILAEGRDLVDLRRQLGGEASRSLQQAVAPNERDDVSRWDFGDLPERVEVASGGRKVAAFPALAEEAGLIRLRLIDSPVVARESHRRGVCRLVWRTFPDLFKQVEKDLTIRLKPAALQYALLDKTLSLNALLADVLYSAAHNALTIDPADLRQQNAFDSAAQSTRPRLAEIARETARLTAECLDHGHRLNQQLSRPLASREAAADMQNQLANLVYPGFIARLEPKRLSHLPRYLKAMERRLEKLASRPDRDSQAMRSMTWLISQWQARCKREMQASGISAEMEDFRWRLEELRVSLFAQELKTPEPVSIKRLEKIWFDLNN
jgi:ATP-dependent helicase HrpA